MPLAVGHWPEAGAGKKGRAVPLHPPLPHTSLRATSGGVCKLCPPGLTLRPTNTCQAAALLGLTANAWSCGASRGRLSLVWQSGLAGVPCTAVLSAMGRWWGGSGRTAVLSAVGRWWGGLGSGTAVLSWELLCQGTAEPGTPRCLLAWVQALSWNTSWLGSPGVPQAHREAGGIAGAGPCFLRMPGKGKQRWCLVAATALPFPTSRPVCGYTQSRLQAQHLQSLCSWGSSTPSPLAPTAAQYEEQHACVHPDEQ